MACECGIENRAILASVRELTRKVDQIRDDHIDPIRQDLAVVKEKVNLVHKTVHEGNGQPSLVARVTVLETAEAAQERFNTSKSGISISRLAFWGAIIAAMVSALSAITVALMSHRGGV